VNLQRLIIAAVMLSPASSMSQGTTAPTIAMELALTAPEVEYVQFPGAPAGLLSAIVVGNLGESAPYVLRNKLPPNFTFAPHKHVQWRVLTVIEGTVYFAYGDKIDAGKLRAFGPGSVIVEPKDVWHYLLTKDQPAVVQYVGEGPGTTTMAP